MWAALGKSAERDTFADAGAIVAWHGVEPTRMVADVDSEYRMTSLQSPPQHTIFFGHPESVKPVIMTGQMYGSTATAADETEFYNAVIMQCRMPYLATGRWRDIAIKNLWNFSMKTRPA